MNAADIAVVLLAAGRGTRFGGGKLAADLAGKPVVDHVAEQLAGMAFSRRIVVCSGTTPAIAGFERVTLAPGDAPLSRSIATGVSAVSAIAREGAVLIVLADMPLVPADHFASLIERFDGDRIGSHVGGRIMVPAVFGQRHFAALSSLEGDQGAAALLRDAASVPLDEELALDIDTPDDLARAARLLQGR